MIYNFKVFCEAISGQEMIGSMGPNYGDTTLPTSLTKNDTTVVFSTLDNKFYTFDEYDEVYQDYLKKNGPPLDGFNEKNLDLVIDYLQGKNESIFPKPLNHDSYKEIHVGDVEFSKLLNWEEKGEDFTQDEIDKILSNFKSYKIKWGYSCIAPEVNRFGDDGNYVIDDHETKHAISIKFYQSYDNSILKRISIEKFKDEWYYVSTTDAYHSNGTYYSCDQFDGLMNLLSNLLK